MQAEKPLLETSLEEKADAELEKEY